MTTAEQVARAPAVAGSGLVLATLATGQFLMTLDTAVMNVSIAQVAHDVGTTVTGIQSAITLYTLVMATMMITGGKIGSRIGRRRAFSLGCVVYGAGSFTTSIAPNLTVLMFGWSLLEGLGAALIMPAIVGLVATNFEADQRPRAYGLVASAGAVAVAVGPLVGGAVTTLWTWRLVFAGEVILVLGILLLARKCHDIPVTPQPRIDFFGIVLSALGLGSIVYGVLRSSEWGWVTAKSGAPSVFGISLTLVLIFGGLLVLWCFLLWEGHLLARGRDPLVDPGLLQNAQLRGGMLMFFFQFLIQAGLFFTIPLFLSVALGLTAVQTGVRLLPLSLTLLAAAAGVPKFFPKASPRRVVTWGLVAMLAGILTLVFALDAGAGAEVVTVPLLLAGLGVGALASQLGAVTVSSVPDERSGDVGGLQNTASNLGASLGTALAGSVLIAGLTASFLSGITDNPAVPKEVAAQAQTDLASGAPFISDAQLSDALQQTSLSPQAQQAVLDENETSRIAGLQLSLALLAFATALALLAARLLPRERVS